MSSGVKICTTISYEFMNMKKNARLHSPNIGSQQRFWDRKINTGLIKKTTLNTEKKHQVQSESRSTGLGPTAFQRGGRTLERIKKLIVLF